MYRRTAVHSQRAPCHSCSPPPSRPLAQPFPALARSPESLDSLPIGRFSQFLARPFSNLTNSLTRDAHQRSDLLERHRLAALFESVVEIENLALARREVLLEDPIDELAHQLAVGALFDLAALLSREPLAERRGIFVGAIDGRVERQLRRGHAARGAHVLDAVFQRLRDFVVGRFSPQLLREVRLGAAHPNELRILVERNANAARLLRQRLQHRLPHPPHCVRNEFDALVGIELLDRFQQTFVADRDELGEIESVALIFFYVGDDETQIGSDETLGGFFIATLHATSEATFFSGIFDEGKFLYVLQVLVECSGRGGAEKGLRLAAIRPRHARLPLKRELVWKRRAKPPLDHLNHAPI